MMTQQTRINITQSKINAARFDYEFLGKSTNQIASDYGFPLVNLEGEILNSQWERKIEPTQMPATKDMQKFADELEKITRSKLSIISLFRQIDNQALYAQLETAILNSALEAVHMLSPDDDRIATKLAALTKTLTQIQERNPIQLADQLQDTLKKDPGIVVNIANQVQ
jgi:hypothetical protein